MVARSVLKAVLPDIPHDEVDYNVVQNNGRISLPLTPNHGAVYVAKEATRLDDPSASINAQLSSAICISPD